MIVLAVSVTVNYLAWTFWGETELKFSLKHTRLSKASQTHAIVFQLINQQQSFQFFIYFQITDLKKKKHIFSTCLNT